MFGKLLSWLKQMGYKRLILEMDQLEKPLALKLQEAQRKFGSIPPDDFAKVFIDDLQRFLCEKTGVDPKEIGL